MGGGDSEPLATICFFLLKLFAGFLVGIRAFLARFVVGKSAGLFVPIRS